jgi:hypothetical protein
LVRNRRLEFRARRIWHQATQGGSRLGATYPAAATPSPALIRSLMEEIMKVQRACLLVLAFIILNSGCGASKCRAIGEDCSANAECCGANCSGGSCKAKLTDMGPSSDLGECIKRGEPCSAPASCCSMICAAGACGCKQLGTSCVRHNDCCPSTFCGGGTCIPCAPNGSRCQAQEECCGRCNSPGICG